MMEVKNKTKHNSKPTRVNLPANKPVVLTRN